MHAFLYSCMLMPVMDDQLDVHLSIHFQHHVATYCDLLPACLEMAPGSTFVDPEIRKMPLPHIKGIFPEINSIDIHCYEREVAILVSGKNLWFARDIQVNETKPLRLHPCAQENAERQIQVMYDRKRAETLLQEEERKWKVSLGSCFAVDKETRKLNLTVKVGITCHAGNSCKMQVLTMEFFAPTLQYIGISLRQAQLAKLSHPQLIFTALLSAALERRSKSTQEKGAKAVYSRKYNQIRLFLKLALDVVPIEGFFHCLAEPAQVFVQDPILGGAFLLELFQTVNRLCSRSVNIPSSETMFKCLDEVLHGNMSTFFAMCQLIDKKDIMQVQLFLQKERKRIKDHMQKSHGFPVLSEVSIREILCASQWKDPVEFLDRAVKDLDEIASSEATTVKPGDAPDKGANQKLLALVQELTFFSYCLGEILDSFMSAQVQIPFSQSPEDTARALESTGVAVGVWYLIGLSFIDMKRIVQDRKLVIDVASYLESFLVKKKQQ